MFTLAEQLFEANTPKALPPGQIERVAASIAERLASIDSPLPSLSHVEIDEVEDGWASITCHIHLTPTLRLPVEMNFGSEYDHDVADLVGVVRGVWPARETIAEVAELQRTALEAALEQAGAGAVGIRLREVHLGPLWTWIDDDKPALAAHLEMLGEDLRSRTVVQHVTCEDDLVEVCSKLVDRQRPLLDTLRRMVRLKATGEIDLIAAAAIDGLQERNRILRELGRDERIWSDGDLCLYWRAGRVHSAADDHLGLRWSESALAIAGTRLSETALANLEGRPVTDLVQHPLLRDSMIVASACNSFDDDDDTLPVLAIVLKDDHLVFSSTRQTIWNEPFDTAE